MPSSAIAQIAYREERSELIVTFTSGKLYAYGLVPQGVYDDFRRSGSKGHFFNTRIRDRYPARRLASSSGTPANLDWGAALKNLREP